MKKNYGFCLSLWFLTGCGVDLSTQLLTIEMYGLSKLPSSSKRVYSDETPFFDPISQEYTIENVTLTGNDGTRQALSIAEGSREFNIVNRAQIIFKFETSSLIGNSYEKLEVEFAPEVKGQVGDQEVGLILQESSVSFSETITVETGQSLSYDLTVNWRYTVDNTGAMSEPELKLVQASD